MTAADVGHTVRVTETATNAGGSSTPAVSAATGVVQPLPSPVLARPANTSGPVVSGSTTLGQSLATSTGAWSGTAPISYSYQWQRCDPGCASIPAATASAYQLVSADQGALIQVVVTASNSAGIDQATSNRVGPISAGLIAGTVLRMLKPAEVCARVSIGRVCLPAARSRHIVLVPGGVAWRGLVELRTSGGSPVSGAAVQMIDAGRPIAAQTDRSGTVRFAVRAGTSRTVRFIFAGSSADQGSSASIEVSNRAASMLYLVRGVGGPGKSELAGVAIGPTGARARERVSLQLQRSGRWVTVAVTRTSSRRGWWNATVDRPRRGRHYFRTVIDHTPSTRVAITVG